MFEGLRDWLMGMGIGEESAGTSARMMGLIIILLLSLLAYMLIKRVLVRELSHTIARTGTKRDDILLKHRVLSWISLLVPAGIFYLMIPFIFTNSPDWIAIANQLVYIYTTVIGIFIIENTLDVILDIYDTFEVSKAVPLKGPIQVLKIVVYFIGIILVISAVLGRSPLVIIGGLGALTAVIMLIFQDSILGLVAGIQLSANRMIAKGDWIEMPKYDADGVVTDVALTTVKVQNADQTITTIPTYALISESFKNWRGMEESTGRRIKRALFVDLNTIRFCTSEMLEKYSHIPYVADYLQQETAALKGDANAKTDISLLAAGFHVTNVSAYRAYIQAYLHHHPMIHHELTLVVRPLSPSTTGLPIEVYAFSKEKVWAKYEQIQADIFDHLIAIVPAFDLKIFQNPSGVDMRVFADQTVGFEDNSSEGASV